MWGCGVSRERCLQAPSVSCPQEVGSQDRVSARPPGPAAPPLPGGGGFPHSLRQCLKNPPSWPCPRFVVQCLGDTVYGRRVDARTSTSAPSSHGLARCKSHSLERHSQPAGRYCYRRHRCRAVPSAGLHHRLVPEVVCVLAPGFFSSFSAGSLGLRTAPGTEYLLTE